ncbi:hypothetical protein C4564_04975 [Candidatus Microgenomates bacterium]|nr:MAG: hypothetical protein C4564_04975 [Candidatus Microgenomates bacterium]
MKHYKSIFVCPNDGEISDDDVAFICNTCDTKEVIKIEGLYVCPQCSTSVHPFQCRICDGKDVVWLTPLTETYQAAS